jgi:hypothetical protein
MKPLDEHLVPGACPLCLAGLMLPDQPGTSDAVLRVLAKHFETACPSIKLRQAVSAKTPRAVATNVRS